MEKIIVALWILLAFYLTVLLAILADLWSGVRKAKAKHEERRSEMYRKTMSKLSQYYNVMFALTIIDTIQITLMWYLETYCDRIVAMFPFGAMLGAIGITLIELKSIKENSDEKKKVEQLGTLVTDIAKDHDSVEDIVKAVMKYMNDKK